ncbi:XRE family transcriptional regulator [Brevibacillus laterosporus]|nr:helix-turn-helix transcriptional regulator [Brevibacillus laterosporus]TPG72915.1 XRE family transcriptional regulator [Brevibacillus laterosporus]TPG86874.1 XRE family transcriptional regulator [Brevibacillus laterosporus]
MNCRLKLILVERKIRQREFAKQIGMGEAHFSRIVNGAVIPTLDIAFRISQALSLKVEDIWESK